MAKNEYFVDYTDNPHYNKRILKADPKDSRGHYVSMDGIVDRIPDLSKQSLYGFASKVSLEKKYGQIKEIKVASNHEELKNGTVIYH